MHPLPLPMCLSSTSRIHLSVPYMYIRIYPIHVFWMTKKNHRQEVHFQHSSRGVFFFVMNIIEKIYASIAQKWNGLCDTNTAGAQACAWKQTVSLFFFFFAMLWLEKYRSRESVSNGLLNSSFQSSLGVTFFRQSEINNLKVKEASWNSGT